MKVGMREGAALLGFAGFVFCLLSFWGIGDALCLSSGCDVYKGYQVFGVSLYLVGAVVFLGLGGGALWFFEKRWFGVLTALALSGNIFFLSIQIFLWPCTSCLTAAAFFGAVAFLVFLKKSKVWHVFWLFWFLLFFSASLGALRDSIRPWALQERDDSGIRIFFSPSCPSCRELVERWMQDPLFSEKMAFYPIAKDGEDRKRILFLKKELDQGMGEAEAFSRFWAGLSHGKAGYGEEMGLALKLWRNTLVMAKAGESRVPFVIFRNGTSIPGFSAPDAEVLPSQGCSIISGGQGICVDELAPGDPFRRGW
jgi:hypothetical protein